MCPSSYSLSKERGTDCATSQACCNLYLRERQSSSFELGTGEVIILLEVRSPSSLNFPCLR